MKSTVVDESLSTTTTRVLFQRETTYILHETIQFLWGHFRTQFLYAHLDSKSDIDFWLSNQCEMTGLILFLNKKARGLKAHHSKRSVIPLLPLYQGLQINFPRSK